MIDEQNQRTSTPENLDEHLESSEVSEEANSNRQEAMVATELDSHNTHATVETTLPEEQTGDRSQLEGEEPLETVSVVATLTEEIETLRQQLDTFKTRYITLAAEFDNFRKRTIKEKEELEKQIKCKTLSELLTVVDNFERARNQIKPTDDGEMAIHKSYQGVYKNLVDSLKRLGVSAMRPEGEPFDPAYHEAMLREYTDEYPEGTVIEQLVRGYLLDDRVLRHAMVKVAAAQEPVITSEEETQEVGERNESGS